MYQGSLAKDQRQQPQPVPGNVFIFPAFPSMFQKPKNLVCGIPGQPREGDGDSLLSSCPLTWKKAFPPSRSVMSFPMTRLGCHYQEMCPTVSAISEWLCQSAMPLAAVSPTLLLLLKRAASVPGQGQPRACCSSTQTGQRKRQTCKQTKSCSI